MTLDDYLKQPNALPAVALAKIVGCNRSHITRLRNNERTPSMAVARKIEAATGGKVPVSSWAVAA